VVRVSLKKTADPDKIHAVDCDVFSPCALGGIIRDDTLPELKCRIVAGSANNQLEHEEHGEALQQMGILYAPDYVINGGGLINVNAELQGWTMERARNKAGEIGGMQGSAFGLQRSSVPIALHGAIKTQPGRGEISRHGA